MSEVADFTPGEKVALLATLARIEARLAAAFNQHPASGAFMPSEVTRASDARNEAFIRGHHTVATFAQAIGRHRQWVSDRCCVGTIKTLPGGKPYRIPLSEEKRFNHGL